jgi:pyruvate dehydrogenase E2 component (dihydrolipoamide acetyltransferase)
MPIEITMPRLSDTMERGTIIKWSVKEGDEVSAGDAVADIETDKATMEMQVYDDGTIARIVVGEGQTVEVGTLIALMAEADEDVSEVAASAATGAGQAGEPAPAAAAATEGPAAEKPPAPAREPAGDGRIRMSPVARRLADEHGVDVATIQGSGPGGRIIKRDVMRAVETGRETAAAIPPSARPTVPAVPVTPVPLPVPSVETPPVLEAGTIELTSMRQTIARRLVEAKTTIPHYQVTVTFNMDPLLALRSTLNEQLEAQGVKLSVSDFLIRACALAIHRHPQLNASWGGDHIEIHGEVNIGFAISVPPQRGGGLVVGTLRNADRKSLRGISQESRYLADKARNRGLTIEEMSDSTFTLSNLGMYGVDHFTAIINPPNSAILAVGAALQKPVVRDGELTVGHEMSATLSLDHRVIDGATAAGYLATLREMIENPATLLV